MPQKVLLPTDSQNLMLILSKNALGTQGNPKNVRLKTSQKATKIDSRDLHHYGHFMPQKVCTRIRTQNITLVWAKNAIETHKSTTNGRTNLSRKWVVNSKNPIFWPCPPAELGCERPIWVEIFHTMSHGCLTIIETSQNLIPTLPALFDFNK